MIRAAVFVSRHFTFFACLAYLAGWAERIAEALLHDGPLHALRANNLTQYFVSYPDHGFAKRALVGTVLRPLLSIVEQPQLWAFWIMVVLNIAGFAALLWLVRHWLAHDDDGGLAAILRAALAVGSVGVVQIAHDYGRFDILNFGMAALALGLASKGRVWAAGLACAGGILIHEAFVIYAAPLVVATAWAAANSRRPIAAAGPVAFCSGAAALAVLIYGGSDSAAALQIGTGGYVWQRGLIEIGWGLPWYQVAVLAGYWSVLLGLLVGTYRANAKPVDLFALAALCPLALNLFGIDHGRWVMIEFLTVTAALALQVRHFGFRWPDLRPWQARAACLLALPLGPHGVTGAWTWFL